MSERERGKQQGLEEREEVERERMKQELRRKERHKGT